MPVKVQAEMSLPTLAKCDADKAIFGILCTVLGS